MTTITGRVPTDIPPAPVAGALGLLSWVPDDEIPKAHRAYVAAHVRRLARRYGLPRVTVRYFGPPRRGPVHELHGRYVDRGDFHMIATEAGAIPVGVAPEDQPDTIALHYALRGPIAVHTIAHEIAHLVQRRDSRPADEAECARVAARYVLGRLSRHAA